MARVPDAAVCDTNALISHGFGSRRMGRAAGALFEACDAQQAIIYVPAAVILEFGFVLGSRRSPARIRLRGFFEDLFANPAFQPYDLTPEQINLADEEGPNRDPFDRLICAAARRLDLPVITCDAEIAEWGRVRVVW